MQPAKILVADDEQNLRRVLVALLRREGHDVVQAASGLEAIDRLADVDVVITDLRMPGADGMEVLRSASKHHPHVPVIMITAYGSIGQAAANKLQPQPTLYSASDLPSGRYGLVGTSPEMHSVFAVIEKVADTPST